MTRAPHLRFLLRRIRPPAWALAAILFTAPAARAAPAATPPSAAAPRLTGTPLLRVWGPEDYGAALLNTRLLVHPGGRVYVANDNGVLEFDGEHWRLIPLPGEGAARALALDPAGQLWVFGHDDIATLEPDARGELQAVSKIHLLPAHARATGTINRAAVTPDGVYARGQRRLMLFRPDGTVQTWEAANLAGLVWAIGNELYADLETLVHVTPAATTPVSFGTGAAASKPDNLRVFAAQPSATSAGEALLLAANGPLRWRGPGTAPRPLSREASAVFAASPASAAAFLPDGRLALGTERSGLFIFERDGRLSQQLDREHGLPGNRINDLVVDAEGGLWVALQEGLARLDLNSPFALHGAPQGLTGHARRFASWRDQLYLATSEGLARRDSTSGRFVPIEGFQVGANRPLVVGPRLVAATRGLREIGADDRSRAWTPELIGPIVASTTSPGIIYAGSSAGLWIILPQAEGGGWKTAGRITSFPLGVDELLERGDGWLWAVTRGGDIARVDLHEGARLTAPSRLYLAVDGVPEAGRNDRVQLVPIGDDLLAVATDWIRRYDSASDRFVPESRLVVDRLPVRGARLVGRSAEGGLWLRPITQPGRLLQVMPARDGAWRSAEHSIAPFRGATFDSLFEETTTRTLWLAGQGVFASFDLDWRPARPLAPLRVVIRRIEGETGAPLAAGPLAARPLALSAEQTAVRIVYAASTFGADYRGRSQTLYRTRLDGLDREWTAWTRETHRDFTNLPPGRLRFRVQARVPGRADSEEALLAFTVAAPWWRTTPAFLGYGLALAGVIYGGFRLRTLSLQRRNAQLEALVAARTRQLERLNLELTDAVQVVAHDLRGPVAGIRSLARQLRATPHIWASAEGPEFLGEIERTSGAAIDMMARLLDVQRANDRAEGLVFEAVDVGSVIQEVGRQLAPAATAKRIALHIEAPPVLRITDAESVASIAANLVSNALKFLPADGAGRVNVTLSVDDTTCLLSVADNGPGISPAERATLFEKFSHGAARPTAGETSTGLGLYIVKRLIDALSGSIEVVETPGGGATFIALWPATPVAT